MSTIIVAIIIILAVVLICIALVVLSNRSRQQSITGLSNRLSESGTKNAFSFSSQEMFTNSIIGLDGINKKLVIVKRLDENEYQSAIVNLNHVERCYVKRLTRSIGTEDRNSRTENHLEQIALHFEFIDGQQAVDVHFYDHLVNSIFEMPGLEQKAKSWEAILSKILRKKSRN